MEDNRKNSLEKLFERFKGQPIEVLTSDGVRYCGIDLNSNGDSVEIIDKCNRIVFIPFAHIDAVVEPMMRLTRFCGDNDCDCHKKREHCGDDDCRREHCDECDD